MVRRVTISSATIGGEIDDIDYMGLSTIKPVASCQRSRKYAYEEG